MHLMHTPLEFAQSVSNFFGNIDRRQLTDGLIAVGMGVSDCGISSNYFRSLYEMPTDLYPSVLGSVIVAFQVVKYRRTYIRQYRRR